MKTIIVGKLLCDDSILKASRTMGAREVKDVISAALTFTPFTVEKVNLVFARVSEKYYLACKKLGYDWGFFRENRLLALCSLRQGGSQYNASDFEGIYVPFSGEIYLVPNGIFDLSEINIEKYEAVLHRCSGDGYDQQLSRHFTVTPETEQNKESLRETLAKKFWGTDELDLTGKVIASLTATADVRTKLLKDGTSQEETKEAMYFLYNGW